MILIMHDANIEIAWKLFTAVFVSQDVHKLLLSFSTLPCYFCGEMSLTDLCVCCETGKEIHCVTCKLFASKLGTEFVFRKFMSENACM
jgi:hypothetical protein